MKWKLLRYIPDMTDKYVEPSSNIDYAIRAAFDWEPIRYVDKLPDAVNIPLLQYLESNYFDMFSGTGYCQESDNEMRINYIVKPEDDMRYHSFSLISPRGTYVLAKCFMPKRIVDLMDAKEIELTGKRYVWHINCVDKELTKYFAEYADALNDDKSLADNLVYGNYQLCPGR